MTMQKALASGLTDYLLLNTRHHGLYILDLTDDFMRKMLIARFCNRDVVLDTEPDVFILDVNSYVDGKHHAGLNRISLWPDIMNIQTYMMRAFVPVVFAYFFVLTKVSSSN